MLRWLRKNWRWAILNAVAAVIMFDLLRNYLSISLYHNDFGPLVESGKWGIRFLLFSLAMSPLNSLFGLREAIPLRKPAGLWAFGFIVVHFIVLARDPSSNWLQYPIPDWYAGLGVIALIGLGAMAATSTKWAQRRMGKWWKRLHRLVYGISIIGLTHGLLESSNKRVMITDMNAAYEVTIYILILAILLLVRMPSVRSWLTGFRQRRRQVTTGSEA